ncbi:aminoglycoside phosphotransferase family protein [Kitasatospora sp. McL0602]|uniref:aminoglycoside phosphotransferase family protein n=1 Tax=Kitasatospora sp. McL0602 TaxID=3439530 RepID=UPI003F8B8DB7
MPAAGQFTVPDRLAAHVREDSRGAAWLAALPELVTEHLTQWGLTLERVCLPGGRRSFTACVRRADGSPAVLKVTPDGAAAEAAALDRWAGQGAAQLLAADAAAGVLLLERLHGDIPLRSLPEAKAMLEATSLLRHLWVAPADGHALPRLADRVADATAMLRQTPALPEAAPLVDEALEAAAGLLADQPEELLLHGDFHHGKVLAAERSPWLAVSPEPLVGERAYDLAWLARDRLDTLAGSPGPKGAARRRLHRLADDVEVEHDRLRGWTLFRAVEAGLRSFAAGDGATAELYLGFADWL